MLNAQMLDIPSNVPLVAPDEVDRLEQRRQERLAELRKEGWMPSEGWAANNG